MNSVLDNFGRCIARILLDRKYCAILMFHRVSPIDKNRLRCNDHLKVSPLFFERTIRSLKMNGYSFVSMDELASNLKRHRLGVKTVAITFDDGYKDVFVNGYPILKSENVPGCVYVSTGLHMGDGIAWWDALEDFLLANNEIEMPDGSSCDIRSYDDKTRCFMALRQWIFSLHKDDVVKSIIKLCNLSPNDVLRYSCEFASDDIIQSFKDDKLLSIGCHTHRHVPCGRIGLSEAMSDINQSLFVLNKLGVKPYHFAFPYGGDVTDPRQFAEWFSKNGILTAVTTFGGVAYRSSDPYFLPRIGVMEYNHFSADHVFEARYAEVKRKVKAWL